MKQLSETTWYLPFSEETDRPNLGYIRGERYSLMVDGGNSPAHVNLFLSGLEGLGLPGPDYTAVTHWHWDHTYGLCGLRCPVIAGRKTARELEKMSTWRFDRASMERRLRDGEEIPFCHENILREYPSPEEIRVRRADLVFDGVLELDLGGVCCRLIPVDGPHSRDSVAVYLPEEKILFLGDSMGEEFYEGKPHYSRERLAPYIGLLESIPFSVAISGHDEPEEKSSLLKYLKETLAAL
jgi:glyoxylase-like metal-dependent hydrolase (beta-lactamase superfamily II)